MVLVKSAQSDGEVTFWGGDSVTAHGVCWNTSGNPTVSDSKTVDGSGTGTFSSTLYPLEANTTYYVRAYASNSSGTGYGAVDTFNPSTMIRFSVPKESPITVDIYNIPGQRVLTLMIQNLRGFKNLGGLINFEWQKKINE